jgi:hypothetical protein
VHTIFLTAALERTPTRADQAEMGRALRVLERFYPWGAAHLVTFVSYGLPYLGRLPGGARGRLVSRHMPRLPSDTSGTCWKRPCPADRCQPGQPRYPQAALRRPERTGNSPSGRAGHCPGNPNRYADGGGPALLPNQDRGPHYAARTARGIGTQGGEHRMGHLSCLQRSSRAADGTPIHIRMDVPGGVPLPKLQFTIFVPSAEFFRTLRTNQASLDLQHKYGVSPSDNGLERFITATRRQNFLIPPRRHRAFPLAELA